MHIDYHLLDVFTREPLTGNPLAVFVDQDITDDALMQRIARELNLSETVFVSSPSDGGGWPTRIFTPSVELPFAGHPTVGTAVLLGSLGLVTREVVLAEGVGDVRVRLARSSEDVWSGELTTATLPTHVAAVTPAAAAAALGLAVDDLHADFAPAVWDCGVPFAMVVLRDVDTLGRARSSDGVAHASGVFALAPVEVAPASRWRARSFVTLVGIAEDPATGGAVAALAGLFAAAGALRGIHRFDIAQGVEMGRPSQLVLSIDRDTGGRLAEVRVGGEAVVVGGGTLRL